MNKKVMTTTKRTERVDDINIMGEYIAPFLDHLEEIEKLTKYVNESVKFKQGSKYHK